MLRLDSLQAARICTAECHLAWSQHAHNMTAQGPTDEMRRDSGFFLNDRDPAATESLCLCSLSASCSRCVTDIWFALQHIFS